MRPLVVLRPEPGASATAQRARALGLDVTAIPLFAIEPMRWSLPEVPRFDALLVTSANAIRFAGPQTEALREMPVHAVGPATAEAARDAGLQLAGIGSAGVEALLRELSPELRLLHLCGEDRIEPSTSRNITSVPVYRATALAHPEGLDRLTGAVALVHSPRAGWRLRELAPSRADTVVAAISSAAAASCGPGWEEVAIAERPRDDALLSLGARLCKHFPPK